MDLQSIYYQLDSRQESNEDFINFLIDLDDEEIEEELHDPVNAFDFLKEFKLQKIKNFGRVTLELAIVGKYVHQDDTVSSIDLPAKVAKGYRDRLQLLDALDSTPDFNSRK
jgi:hypothetical protein